MDKRYDNKAHESRVQKKWTEEKTYSPTNNPGTFFSIDTPPPTVSGSLHIGHIFSYTQTDIIARHKRMNGFSVYYPFGFDDNGLPTERYVEKIKKTNAYKVGRTEFITLCLEETQKAAQQFTALWQRMGLSANWDMIYSTISAPVRRLSQASFIELYRNGFIYRRNEPALYCTTCRTSVAQAELEDRELPSFFNDIVFKDEKGNDLIIGTTRPELLPSCVALFFNPEDERYKHLENTKATVPIFGHQVPIYADECVDMEKGTGLVMCCTFGDKTDIEWYKAYNLPYRQSIGFDGRWVEDTGILAGKKVAEARQAIIETLIKENLLLRQKEINHAVNVHERCKKEIEFVMLPQWFLRIVEHKQKLLDLGDQIEWYPHFMKTRYRDWVQNISWDWCLSRQRYYGIPFPVWHCANCNEIILADLDQLPVDPQETQPKHACSKCNSKNLIPDTDVMDTWNTSSLTPYICSELYTHEKIDFTTKKLPPLIPMSMRPQAHDIIRTWAFYTISRTWMHNNIIPWNEIVISGHVLSDTKGKLSKSQEHAIRSPEKLLEKYPADAIRYWTASGTLGHDVAFSEEQLKVGIKLITKLWNAFKFAKDHIQDVSMDTPPNVEPSIINQWLLHTLSKTFDDYQNYFEKNEFSLALHQIEKFFWNNFCDTYLELIKHQLFNPDEYDTDEVAATRSTLAHAGLRILQLYAPFMPHITEVLYEIVYKEKAGIASLHQTRFANWHHQFVFEDALKPTQQLLDIINQVRKLKTAQQLSLKSPLETLTIEVSTTSDAKLFKNHAQLLRGITHAKEIHTKEGKQHDSQLINKDELWHAEVRAS